MPGAWSPPSMPRPASCDPIRPDGLVRPGTMAWRTGVEILTGSPAFDSHGARAYSYH